MVKNSKSRKGSKNILVPTVRWREVHPIGVACKSDAYYAKIATRLANMIRDMIGNAIDATDDDIVDVAIELAAYLEDKINGLNLWNAFMALYREKFGRGYPFYDVREEDLFDDEPNLPDLRFILWRALDRISSASLLNPMTEPILRMSEIIHDFLMDEFEAAPESPEIVEAIYTAEKYDDVLFLRSMCSWLAARAYLTAVYDVEYCFDEIFGIYKSIISDNENVNEMMVAYGIEAYFAFNAKIGPLGLVATEWLGKMMELSGDESIRKIATDISAVRTRTLLPYDITAIGQDGFKVESLAGDIMEMSFDPLPENTWGDIRVGHQIIAALFEYKGWWKVNGMSSIVPKKIDFTPAKKEYAERLQSQKISYDRNIRKNNGSRIGVAADMYEFKARFDLDKVKNPKIDESILEDVDKAKEILYFINDDGSMSILPNFAPCVDIPGNPYYNVSEATARGAMILCGHESSTDMRQYIIDNGLMPDARLASSSIPDPEAKKWFAKNAPFLVALTHTDSVAVNMP